MMLFALTLTTLAGLSTGLGGLVVFLVRRPRQRTMAFSLGFAGGVMITVSLSDMLPHAVGTYTETMGRFPAALAAVSLCAAGMMIALLLERCVPDEAELAARHAGSARDGKSGRGGAGGTGSMREGRRGAGHAGGAAGTGSTWEGGRGTGSAGGAAGTESTWKGGRGAGHAGGSGYTGGISGTGNLQESGHGAGSAGALRSALVTTAAIVLHNLPEGILTLFTSYASPALGMTLTLAIALHNIPEGIAISVPVYYATGSRVRAVLYALFSGLAEPAGALLAVFLLRGFLSPLFLNGLIATVAGIMIYVSISELVPEGFSYGKRGHAVAGLAVGVLTMSIGICLGEV